ncbi:MAG: hypothetical protein V1731_02855 [Candidatus Aenigmatarchaeota archaeon]
MNSRRLKVIGGAIADFFEDILSLEPADSQTKIMSMLERRGFALKGNYSECGRFFYKKGDEAFLVGDVATIYRGSKELGTKKIQYDGCNRRKTHKLQKCVIEGYDEYMANVDLVGKIRKFF